jgi:hypothetical protein
MPEAEVVREESREPKEFVVILPVRADKPAARKEIRMKELDELPGLSHIEELDRILGGTLRIEKEEEDIRECRMVVDFEQRVFGSSYQIKDKPIKIVQRRGGCAVAFDCPTFLSRPLAVAFSVCVFGDPNGFEVRSFGRDEMTRIWEHALSIGGKPRLIHLRKIRGESVSIYHVSGRDICGVEEIGDPVKLMQRAKKIKRLGFSFPPNTLGDSSFYFWVADWGGGTLYDPLDPLPHQLLILAEFFDRALLKRKE